MLSLYNQVLGFCVNWDTDEVMGQKSSTNRNRRATGSYNGMDQVPSSNPPTASPSPSPRSEPIKITAGRQTVKNRDPPYSIARDASCDQLVSSRTLSVRWKREIDQEPITIHLSSLTNSNDNSAPAIPNDILRPRTSTWIQLTADNHTGSPELPGVIRLTDESTVDRDNNDSDSAMVITTISAPNDEHILEHRCTHLHRSPPIISAYRQSKTEYDLNGYLKDHRWDPHQNYNHSCVLCAVHEVYPSVVLSRSTGSFATSPVYDVEAYQSSPSTCSASLKTSSSSSAPNSVATLVK